MVLGEPHLAVRLQLRSCGSTLLLSTLPLSQYLGDILPHLLPGKQQDNQIGGYGVQAGFRQGLSWKTGFLQACRHFTVMLHCGCIQKWYLLASAPSFTGEKALVNS